MCVATSYDRKSAGTVYNRIYEVKYVEIFAAMKRTFLMYATIP
jgi:hypothetical protein